MILVNNRIIKIENKKQSKIRGILKEKIWRERKNIMGAAGSKLEKALGDHFPEGERYFGLENFGNTCYCNSVLQVFFVIFFGN